MLLGPTINHKLQGIVSAAGDLRFRASRYVGTSATPMLSDGTNTGPVLTPPITGSGTVDLCAGIAGVHSRLGDWTLRNNSTTVTTDFTPVVTDGTTAQPGPKFTLLPNETLVYGGEQYQHLDANGGVYSSVAQLQAQGVMVYPLFATANITSTKSLTSGTAFALYMGRLTKSITSAQVRYQVTTAMATITWGEFALAKGAVNPGGNPTLTVVGYADISAVANSTGRKITTINLSGGQVLNAGDDLWLIVGNAATTAGVLRAQSIADDNQSGMQASVASRPSTIVGTPTAFTIEAAATLAAWLTAIV